MKKFLEFIWEVIAIPVSIVFVATFGILFLTWIFTFFGLIILFSPTEFPTPEWVRIFIIVFDIIVFGIIIIEQFTKAYKKVYKN